MARIRTIKPEFWQDERLATLPRDDRMLFLGLLNIADDAGRMRGSPLFIRAQVFPYDPDVDVQGGLERLAKLRRIVRYAANGESYIWVRNFNEHQRIDKPKASIFPEPPPEELSAGSVQDASTTHPRRVQDASRQEGKGKEGKGTEVEALTPPPKQHVARTVEAPTTPPEAWTSIDFWRWAQSRRVASGQIAEKYPNLSALDSWWSAATMTPGVTPKALKAGWYAFGEDPHWEKAKPPWPFAAFQSEWSKYTKPEVKRGNAA